MKSWMLNIAIMSIACLLLAEMGLVGRNAHAAKPFYCDNSNRQTAIMCGTGSSCSAAAFDLQLKTEAAAATSCGPDRWGLCNVSTTTTTACHCIGPGLFKVCGYRSYSCLLSIDGPIDP